MTSAKQWMLLSMAFTLAMTKALSQDVDISPEQDYNGTDAGGEMSQAAIDADVEMFQADELKHTEEVIVTLKQGKISGRSYPAGNTEGVYYAFKNIPYAKPPVNELRFMPPAPAERWTGVRNGSVKTNACPQNDIFAHLQGTFKLSGDEDCLYLTVYTPKPKTAPVSEGMQYPVMVWIHGGAFVYGDSDTTPPLPLLNKDIVLVVIQYRLGLLGFLSMEDETLPGNMGLKDQNMALKWVQDNIADLGGDPSRVTIFGVSAGAASVHAQILSKQSYGLFSGAILQSGNMLGAWALRDDHRQNALKMAQHIGCPPNEKEDTQLLLNCFRNASLTDIINAPKITEVFKDVPVTTVPRVDGQFLANHPATILKKKEYNMVPMIAGNTQDEGAVYLVGFVGNETARNLLKEKFDETGPVLLGFNYNDTNKTNAYMAKRAFYHYIGATEFPEDNLVAFKELMEDVHFKKNLDDMAAIHVTDSYPNPGIANDVFLYELTHALEKSLLPLPNVTAKWVSHGDDMQYLTPLFPITRPSDIFVSDMMVDLWTNFARTGNPTPDLSLGYKWERMTPYNPNYLKINTSPTMETSTFDPVREFWRNMPTPQNKIFYPDRFV